MSLGSTLGAVRRHTLGSLYRRAVPIRDRGPIVSFAFDDFPRSAYVIGAPILKRFGARATYYVSAGLMNSKNDLGEQFRSSDLDALIREGHELATHTYSHTSSRSVSASRFRQDVEKGRQEIYRITNVAPSFNFAYPYGHVTLAVKRIIGAKMTSCRGISPGINSPDADLNLLRANSLYGDTSCLSSVKELIAENVKKRGWVIFYTHDVQEIPSRYGCTPALLELALSLSVDRGSRIVTIAEAIAELQSGD